MDKHDELMRLADIIASAIKVAGPDGDIPTYKAEYWEKKLRGLAQGAKTGGVPVYQARDCRDDSTWYDVTKEAFDLMERETEAVTRILYDEPPAAQHEGAAVELESLAKEMMSLSDKAGSAGETDISDTWCSASMMVIRLARTAAPQPKTEDTPK